MLFLPQKSNLRVFDQKVAYFMSKICSAPNKVGLKTIGHGFAISFFYAKKMPPSPSHKTVQKSRILRRWFAGLLSTPRPKNVTLTFPHPRVPSDPYLIPPDMMKASSPIDSFRRLHILLTSAWRNLNSLSSCTTLNLTLTLTLSLSQILRGDQEC